MKLRKSEAALVAAAGTSLVAAVVAALGSTRWAVAVAALALAFAFVGLARVAQLLLRQLAEVQATAQRTGRVVGRLERSRRPTEVALRKAVRQSQRAARVSVEGRRRITRLSTEVKKGRIRADDASRQTLARVDEVLRGAWLDSHRFRTSLDTLPSDTVRLLRATDRLMPGTTDFPGLGDWAITTSTLLAMVDDVASRRGPVTIVECGSGTSTLFLALALSQREEGGRVIALESDADFAEETRSHLARAGVAHLALVVDAPLVERELGAGETRLWFDTEGLPELTGIDLLFVDGPVGGTFPEARSPAFPFFADRLNDGATVVLDDTDRPDERSILEQWTAGPVAGRRLEIRRRNVRSTLLRVVLDDVDGPPELDRT